MCTQLAALFYSKKPQELIYKVGKSCKDINIEVFFVLDFTDLLIKVLHIKPKIIFVDLNSIAFQREIIDVFNNKESPYYVPNVVIVSDEKLNGEIYNDFIVFKTTEISEKIKDYEEIIKYNTESAKIPKLEQKHGVICTEIRNNLLNFGFSSAHNGFQYIIEAVKIIVFNNNVIGTLQHDVYPLIAIKFSTNSINVERDIRNAIYCAVCKCKEKTGGINDLCLYDNEKITNRQFITIIADKIYNEIC
ncbi:MAG: sporulation initiation factor Spo0A C-terminal domain-containing protein [Clostridia bacterium]|jgi:hypothetical protein|nr:sporulation initiation factor Spo0A C-terminal domain-containing protein [Clostridia bacterium]